MQDSTTTIQSQYMIKYMCQNFGVYGVCEYIPNSIYQTSYPRACRVGRFGGRGVTSPPPHTHTHYTHSFLKFVSILTKYVGKISGPNVVGKFRAFYHKNEMQNSINIQSRRNQTFTSDDSF